ncbi:hypothetical protein BKA69DRAFT_411226 [Paraphysoderma sedebokerense]|nr:hypothetical protein BKA69DRAFT_411226 [Paraphysoderma sedebokerense]
MTEGPDGFIYVTRLQSGRISRLFYTTTSLPPVVAVVTRKSGADSRTITFDTTGTYNPTGGALTYFWDFESNGSQDSAVASPTFTYPARAILNATLRVTNSAGQSTTRSIRVTPGYFITVTITTTIANNTWKVGDTFGFSGTARDQDGTVMPASSFVWRTILNHCYFQSACDTDLACHQHGLETYRGVTSNVTTAPEHEYPAYLTIRAIVTHPTVEGVETTQDYDVHPLTFVNSFATVPNGLDVFFGLTLCQTPCAYRVIANSAYTFNTRSPQMSLDGGLFTYGSWSTGAPISQTVQATSSRTLTATFNPVTYTRNAVAAPGGLAFSCGFDVCTLSWTGSTAAGLAGYIIRFRQVPFGVSRASVPFSFYLSPASAASETLRNLDSGVEVDVQISVLTFTGGAYFEGTPSATVTARTSITPPKGTAICDFSCKNKTILIDDYTDDTLLQNAAGFGTNVGGGATLGKNGAAQGTITVSRAGGGGAYWFTKVSENSCFNSSQYTTLRMDVIVPTGMTFNMKLDFLDTACNTLAGSSGSVSSGDYVRTFGSLTTIEIPLAAFGPFPRDRLTAIVIDFFSITGTLTVDNIVLINRCSGSPICPSLVVDAFENRAAYANGVNSLSFATNDIGMGSDVVGFAGLELVPLSGSSWFSEVQAPGVCGVVTGYTHLEFDYSGPLVAGALPFNVILQYYTGTGACSATNVAQAVVPGSAVTYVVGGASVPLSYFPGANLDRVWRIILSGFDPSSNDVAHDFKNLRFVNRQSCRCDSIFLDNFDSAAQFGTNFNLLGGAFGSDGMAVARTAAGQLSLTANVPTAYFYSNFARAGCYNSYSRPILTFSVNGPAGAAFTLEIQIRSPDCLTPVAEIIPYRISTTGAAIDITIDLRERLTPQQLTRLQVCYFTFFLCRFLLFTYAL